MTAGGSAAAKARQVRRHGHGSMLRRVLAAAGLGGPAAARVEAEAGRWKAGADGERRTARLLGPLRWEGWTVLHDRALPTGRANVDHVLVPPCGRFAVGVDSKKWSARRGVVQAAGDRLWHGGIVQQRAVGSLGFEVEQVARVLGVPVRSVIVVHGAPVDGGWLTVAGVEVVDPVRLLPVLRNMAGRRAPWRAWPLARAARAGLPPYTTRRGWWW